MASPCEVHVAEASREVATEVLATVAAEARRIEQKWSRYRADNIVHRINTAEGRAVVVDEETARLIDYAASLFELSDGRFDITSGVLREAWRFDGSDRVPSRAAVHALLTKVGWRRVRWRRPEITLEPGMQIDFGGDLLATGPSAGGRPWRVGIEAFANPARAAKEIELARGALATSGDARRFLLKDGKRLGHILDPSTGWPVEGAPRSVTVAAPTCTEAGMLATFALQHGADAEAFLEAQGVRHWCLR